MLRRWLPAPLLAIGFLTVIPIYSAGFDDPRAAGRSLRWFPLVGLLVGGVFAAVDRLATSALSQEVSVVLVLTTSAAITGALHLDGLADTADGVFGGTTAERRLEIMRDSRIGSYGVVAVVLALLLAYAALLSTGDTDRTRVLLVVPALSRAGMVYAIAAFPYARPSGLGRTFKDQISRSDFALAAITGLVIAAIGLSLEGLLLWASGIAIALAAGLYFSRRLGGLTGDTYGAIAMISEVLLFLIASASWWR
jgi:adenosylcobinamide-GDP ribazoletransferase